MGDVRVNGNIVGDLNVTGNLALPYQSALRTTDISHSARTILLTGWSGASGVGDFLDLPTDESDEDEIFFEKLSDNEYLFDGKILLNDLYKIIEQDDDIFDPVRGDADTLAGLVLELKGDFPKPGETTSYKNFEFTVEALDKRRIRQIRLNIL